MITDVFNNILWIVDLDYWQYGEFLVLADYKQYW